ncbi:universal stress protein [Umezawaea sp. Da 62-37]|uniref:universal stress protein n=1 Tax=Umezawaea sp. Da 62-37 TaxID=3075927 RepID=UPI0028F6C6B1|nr:universal stress protein [Umezawaea sp. Da 62-37]WNV84835.1 universal stress protein [Umezawaea sp. Da 62-37]
MDGVEIDQLVPTGHLGHVLVELCEGCGTLVLGGHGYRKGGMTVVGATISHCLRHAARPVTVVPFTAERCDSLTDTGAAQQFR